MLALGALIPDFSSPPDSYCVLLGDWGVLYVTVVREGTGLCRSLCLIYCIRPDPWSLTLAMSRKRRRPVISPCVRESRCISQKTILTMEKISARVRPCMVTLCIQPLHVKYLLAPRCADQRLFGDSFQTGMRVLRVRANTKLECRIATACVRKLMHGPTVAAGQQRLIITVLTLQVGRSCDKISIVWSTRTHVILT